MAVYLFDENRWYEDNPETYADSIKGAVTDLIVLVYGHWSGGTIGWQSSLIDPVKASVTYPTRLIEVIAAMNERGIRVHAAFNVCRTDLKAPQFPAHFEGSLFVDIHNPVWQTHISDLMAECAELPIHGICLDFVRTDYKHADGTQLSDQEGESNDTSLATVARTIYEKVGSVNPECIVSSTTTPYRDVTDPKLKLTGRKAIDWANNGYHDILFEMNYGSRWEGSQRVGEVGDPPFMDTQAPARKLLTDKPLVIMVSSYSQNEAGALVPSNPDRFQLVLDAVVDEETLAIYTGWLFTDEHAALTKAARKPDVLVTAEEIADGILHRYVYLN